MAPNRFDPRSATPFVNKSVSEETRRTYRRAIAGCVAEITFELLSSSSSFIIPFGNHHLETRQVVTGLFQREILDIAGVDFTLEGAEALPQLEFTNKMYFHAL